MHFISGFDTNSFQLDIVGFLAILGEGSIDTIVQPITLSWWSLLPRLLPAPQVFIRPSRPARLRAADPNTDIGGKVVGLYSGNKFESLHYLANVLHRGERLPKNSVQLVRLPDASEENLLPKIPTFGWLNILAFLGFAISATLFALSISQNDGMGLMGTIFLSVLSSLSGLANKWEMSNIKPQPDLNAPPGDVVVQYPQGAFIIVRCSEVTARLIYYHPSDRAEYWPVQSTSFYRGICMINTLLLMAGVICLANAGIRLQTGFAGSYLILNMAYWIVAAWPSIKHWDFGSLRVTQIELEAERGGEQGAEAMGNGGVSYRDYKSVLWKAIAITGSTDWIVKAGMAPDTPAWRSWLDDARTVAERNGPKMVEEKDKQSGKTRQVLRTAPWNPRKALSENLARYKEPQAT